jgi:predicted amino acid racemase
MDYPCITINLSKVKINIKLINDRCAQSGISVVGVTKCVLGDVKIAEAFKSNGIDIIGDSRLDNLRKLKEKFGPQQKLLLLRTPMISEIEEMAGFCYASMNTQKKTVSEISKVCLSRKITHNIIIMVETDDRREGLLVREVLPFAEYVIDNCPGVNIWGIGTNARCISKRKPSAASVGILLKLKAQIEKVFSIHIPVVSGGNSSVINLIESGQMPAGINQVRIGEAILLGHETSAYKPIEGACTDAFTLDAEIIEVKRKDGKSYKIIAGLGLQDAGFQNLQLLTAGLEFADQSSDHTVFLAGNDFNFQVGDIISFQPDYFGLLSCMTSPFVKKLYKE